MHFSQDIDIFDPKTKLKKKNESMNKNFTPTLIVLSTKVSTVYLKYNRHNRQISFSTKIIGSW